MAIFIVTMQHPDGDGWNKQLKPHVDYLLELLRSGKLVASGPLKGTKLRSGFLVITAADRAEVEAIVAGDPFAAENLIVDLAIAEWDPVVGALHELSSKQLPGELALVSDLRTGEDRGPR